MMPAVRTWCEFPRIRIRNCLKRGSCVLARYSSIHEKTVHDRSFGRRMGACLQEHLPSPENDGRPRESIACVRYSTPSSTSSRAAVPGDYYPMTSQLPTLEDRLALLSASLALGWHLGEDAPSLARASAGAPQEDQEEPSAKCWRSGQSQSVKTTGVGGEQRGYDGGKKVKGRKRHLLVDTQGLLVLKAKVHSAKVQDLKRASRFCWSSHRSTFRASAICGSWTLATLGKARVRTGWRG